MTIEDDEPTECDLCGESPGPHDDDVLAEFWRPATQSSVVAHGQCGLDAGLELA